MSRGAYWDTELSEVYRSVDTPPQGKPSVSETVVTSVTWTGMFLKMETGIQKENHQGEMRGLLISTTKTQLQSDTEAMEHIQQSPPGIVTPQEQFHFQESLIWGHPHMDPAPQEPTPSTGWSSEQMTSFLSSG